MRLTADSHPSAIARYAHIKPGRGPKSRICSNRMSGTRYACTLPKGHRGPHVAHKGLLKRVAAVWDSVGPQSASTPAPKPTNKPAKRPKKPVGLREKTSGGIVSTVVRAIADMISSPEDVALLAFLVAFIGFAVHWLLLIFLG